MNTGKSGLYIHFPFCASRCIYCGFYSTTQLGLREEYAGAVIRELKMRTTPLYSHPRTVYFGGGTPSVLTTGQLESITNGIAETCDTTHVEEWTMECNPDDMTPELARWITSSPVNRVSMGIQTFSDSRLKWLNRRHDARQARTAMRLLRDAGIGNISIDLMFGFPGETLAEWQDDLREAIALRPEHISAYSLMYDEGTRLYAMREQGRIEEIDDETYLCMFEALTSALRGAGYEHYEISNFCLPGRESRHNSSYWDSTPYLGIGAAAHSYDGERRWWNVSSLSRYISTAASGLLPTEDEELIDSTTRYNDMVTTALRTRRGIHLSTLTPDERSYIMNQARPHIESGKMATDGTRLHLTHEGIFTSDDIMSDLIII